MQAGKAKKQTKNMTMRKEIVTGVLQKDMEYDSGPDTSSSRVHGFPDSEAKVGKKKRAKLNSVIEEEDTAFNKNMRSLLAVSIG
jgi:hypothetical protein